MASNPMQRKATNSFLLGIIVTLLITGAVIALLLVMLKQKDETIKLEQQEQVSIYTLKQNVKAAQVITNDMFAELTVNRNTIPSNAIEAASEIYKYSLQTKEGEYVYTDQYGLYLDRSSGDKAPDTIMEIIVNNGKEFQDSKGNKVSNGDYYVDVNGTIEKVNSTASNIQTDEYGSGKFLIDTQGNDKITRVYQENATGEFYIFKVNAEDKTRTKEYIEIKNVPVLARVNMNKNTILTPELIVQSSEAITDDVRQEEYNMIVLPIDLMTDDYVDVRLMTPSGQNFIVVSKARVEVPVNADNTYVADTIRVKLREDEILAMSSAIVEAAGIKGSKLYVTKYADPAMQTAAKPTYTPNADVTAQIQSDPNIVSVAQEELKSRYSDAAKRVRNEYLQQYANSSDFNSNVQSEMEENIGTSITTRKKYLESLGY